MTLKAFLFYWYADLSSLRILPSLYFNIRIPVRRLDLVEHALDWIQHGRVLDVEEHIHFERQRCLQDLLMLVERDIV